MAYEASSITVAGSVVVQLLAPSVHPAVQRTLLKSDMVAFGEERRSLSHTRLVDGHSKWGGKKLGLLT